MDLLGGVKLVPNQLHLCIRFHRCSAWLEAAGDCQIAVAPIYAILVLGVNFRPHCQRQPGIHQTSLLETKTDKIGCHDTDDYEEFCVNPHCLADDLRIAGEIALPE